MGRAFEYRKAAKLKRWGHMAKTFTRLGKQIAIAVKAGGPEPENNPTLRSVIATCKRENMPKDNIERAIKNAMGKDQSDYKSMTYEGYGPHGIAVFVDTLTDNTTRTVADVRSVFNKFGGNLGTMGSLAFLFDHKCMFTFKIKDGMDMEELILDLIDYDVEDEYEQDDEEGAGTRAEEAVIGPQKQADDKGLGIEQLHLVVFVFVFPELPVDEDKDTGHRQDHHQAHPQHPVFQHHGQLRAHPGADQGAHSAV